MDKVKSRWPQAVNDISKKWTIPIRNWPAALNRFSIEYAYGTSNNN